MKKVLGSAVVALLLVASSASASFLADLSLVGGGKLKTATVGEQFDVVITITTTTENILSADMRLTADSDGKIRLVSGAYNGANWVTSTGNSDPGLRISNEVITGGQSSFKLGSAPTGDSLPPGSYVLATLTLQAEAEGVVNVNLGDFSIGDADTFLPIEEGGAGAAVVVNIVPEPVSALLLGLGALPLIRRRRIA